MGTTQGTTRRRTTARVVEDYLQRVYDRSGPRGILVAGFGATSAGIVVVVGLVTLCYAAYNDKPVQRLVPFALSGAALVSLGLLIGLLASRRIVRTLLDWEGAPPSSLRALEVWETTLAAPRLLVIRCSVVVYGMLVFNNMLIYRSLDLPWSAFPVNLASLLLMVVSGAVAAMLFLEYSLRPLTADVARSLPPHFEPESPRFALHTKAILPIPGVVLYTALIVGGLVDTNADFATQLSQYVGTSVAVAVLAVALYYVLAHAFLDPIDQLTAATQRVHAGDLDSRVPVVSGDEFGGLAFSFNRMLDGLQERERLREHNIELAGALEESLEEIQASRARIVAAADEERRRVERDLHDGAQQRLVMISLKVSMASNLLTRDPDEAAAVLEELRADSARAVEELRDLAHGIYPPLLESDGLASALEDVADQSPLPVSVDGSGSSRYPSAVEAAVYFCCLEALQNATKYAGPDCRVTVHLGDADALLHFSVVDNGQGFDTSSVNGSTGLQNMADRIGALGGIIEVISAPGAGTRVTGTVPV